MKREIIFRGKRIENGEWFYGSYLTEVGRGIDGCQNTLIHFIKDKFGTQIITPETIGQSTGLTDKNGVKIFEGDIFKLGVEKEVFEVRFEHGCFMAFCNGKQYGLIGELQMCFINIIGNIHDNKELIK